MKAAQQLAAVSILKVPRCGPFAMQALYRKFLFHQGIRTPAAIANTFIKF